MSQAAEHKKCRVTIVQPGMPDCVMDVFPALHEKERIFLDHRPGIERKAALMQLLKRYCPSGKYVAEPAYWHQPGARPEDVNTLTLRPEEIPLNTLDGAVFEPLPPKEVARMPQPVNQLANQASEIAELKNTVATLTHAMASLTAALVPERPAAVGAQEAPVSSIAELTGAAPAKRGPGRPRKEE